jgi:hypothetical protein
VATHGGGVYSVDRGTIADCHDTVIDLTMTTAAAANLAEYLTTTARATTFDVVAGTGYWLFGIDKLSAATYGCKLVTGNISLQHESFNLWKTSINLTLDNLPS